MNILTNRRILIIDDNRAIHEDFRKILLPQGLDNPMASARAELFGDEVERPGLAAFEIDSAFQGQEGLEMVRRALEQGRPYAMAFVDVRMPPGWDGVETITHLWKHYSDLQVVICTAYSDYSWAEMIERLGQSDRLLILKKPFDNVEVLQLAHALTNKWMLTQQAKCTLEDLGRLVAERTRELQAVNEDLQREIDERKQAEQSLRLSEERFSKAFRASPLPMIIQSIGTERLVDVNESFVALTGLERRLALGFTPCNLRLWESPERYAGMLDTLRAEKSLRNFESVIRTGAGELRTVLVWAELFQLGGDSHVLFLMQDRTEQVELEQQLRQAQKMEAVGQLAAGVAHDFNNILTIIQCHVSLQLNATSLDARIENSLRQISDASARAASLTRQLLAFSRKQMIQPQVLQLGELLSNSSKMLQRLIGDHIRLVYQFPAKLPSVFADPGSLEQVAMNLAINARDAMPQGGTLTFEASVEEIGPAQLQRHPEARPGTFVCLHVTDTGCGIAEAVQKRIFEPFFTTKETGKGTGMGLSIVYGIVKQHEGWIELQSRVGHGTTFSVFLPATDKREVHQAEAATILALPGHETILLVEDQAPLRELVRSLLQCQGYSVFTAANGVEALKTWGQHRQEIDLLLTDMVMPEGVSGIHLARQLRAERPTLRVVFTSGYSCDLLGEDAKETAAECFLQKPYRPDKLARTVRECLDAPANPPDLPAESAA